MSKKRLCEQFGWRHSNLQGVVDQRTLVQEPYLVGAVSRQRSFWFFKALHCPSKNKCIRVEGALGKSNASSLSDCCSISGLGLPSHQTRRSRRVDYTHLGLFKISHIAKRRLAYWERSMRLFLIRHAESEHNVAGLLAGVTDSALTNHGVVQTQRLGAYLADRHIFTHIYASDLQRAYMTAQAIANAQKTRDAELIPIDVVRLPDLREQDFGSMEGVPWSSKRPNGDTYKAPNLNDTKFKPKETPEAMTRRGETFVDDYLVPLLAADTEREQIVAVVSHGLMLGSLWRCLLSRFTLPTLTLDTSISGDGGTNPMEYHTTWANTGYLELKIVPAALISEADGLADPVKVTSSPDSTLTCWKMSIEAVNSKEHLSNLKRAPGIGSSTYDAKQSTMDWFLKRPKVDR